MSFLRVRAHSHRDDEKKMGQRMDAERRGGLNFMEGKILSCQSYLLGKEAADLGQLLAK